MRFKFINAGIMKAVIQRVKNAAVAVNGKTVGQIDHGLLVCGRSA